VLPPALGAPASVAGILRGVVVPGRVSPVKGQTALAKATAAAAAMADTRGRPDVANNARPNCALQFRTPCPHSERMLGTTDGCRLEAARMRGLNRSVVHTVRLKSLEHNFVQLILRISFKLKRSHS